MAPLKPPSVSVHFCLPQSEPLRSKWETLILFLLKLRSSRLENCCDRTTRLIFFNFHQLVWWKICRIITSLFGKLLHKCHFAEIDVEIKFEIKTKTEKAWQLRKLLFDDSLLIFFLKTPPSSSSSLTFCSSFDASAEKRSQ